MSPSKKIFDGADLGYFRRSSAYVKLHQYINELLTKVEGVQVPSHGLDPAIVTRKKTTSTTRPDAVPESLEARDAFGLGSEPDYADSADASNNPVFTVLVAVLRRYNQYIDDTPPLEGPRRFGNLACKEWHRKVESDTYLRDNLVLAKAGGGQKSGDNNNVDESRGGKKSDDVSISDMEYYLNNSFGSSIRLDFGTGHELLFLAFLGPCVAYLDGEQLLYVLGKYYDVARRLIVEYNLEPAGSHGVWGLDDHFHLIYVIGAAQWQRRTDGNGNIVNGNGTGINTFTNISSVIPLVQNVLTAQVINAYKTTNLYVNAIAFVFKIKLGPFREHLPILFDIHTTVYLWAKVLKGLLKMYEVEVFSKFPVVQHFWFGQLYSWTNAETGDPLPVNEPLPEDQKNDDDHQEPNTPRIRNNGAGVHTTKSNISMTAAPWAMGGGGGGPQRTRLPDEFTKHTSRRK